MSLKDDFPIEYALLCEEFGEPNCTVRDDAWG